MLLRMLAGDYLRRGVAEFIGTFALVFVGAGSLIYSNIVGAALAHGLVIAVMVTAVGMISGGHFNPAVTLAFLVTRRIALSLAGFYWAVQFGAAVLAALLLRWVLPKAASTAIHDGAPSLIPGVSSGKGIAIEAVLTFFLVWVVFATAVHPRGAYYQVAGLAIGLTIALDILMAGGLTGAMMNPARAFGPQLVGDEWTNAWVWYVGPFAGGVIAAIVFELLYLQQPTGTGPEPAAVGEADPGTGTAASEEPIR
jgi:aquaporin Z